MVIIIMISMIVMIAIVEESLVQGRAAMRSFSETPPRPHVGITEQANT